MFLPGENFFRAALEIDPELIDRGVAQRVILASPINLIALLWGAAQAWREQRMTETAQQVCETGRELYKRVSILAEHFETLRRCSGEIGRRLQRGGRLARSPRAAGGATLQGPGRRDGRARSSRSSRIDVVPEAPQAPELLPLFDPARDERSA